MKLRVVSAKRRRTLQKRGEQVWWAPRLQAWVWRPASKVIEAKGFVAMLRGVDLMSMRLDSGPINQEIRFGEAPRVFRFAVQDAYSVPLTRKYIITPPKA